MSNRDPAKESIMTAGPATRRPADRVDLHVGARMRLRRRALGQSQVALAEALGLTFQQIQKYEQGSNRVSASKLFQAAHAQSVDISWYFEGLTQASTPSSTPDPLLAFGGCQGGLEIAAAYVELDTARRASILSIVRAVAGTTHMDQPATST